MTIHNLGFAWVQTFQVIEGGVESQKLNVGLRGLELERDGSGAEGDIACAALFRITFAGGINQNAARVGPIDSLTFPRAFGPVTTAASARIAAAAIA